MPWQILLHPHQRLPAASSLEAWYAALLARLGTPSPFELALLALVAGALCATERL